MRYSLLLSTTLAMFATAGASAATFVFDSDPFAGSDALTTPGRQIVGAEPFISFDALSDRYLFRSVVGLGSPLNFANGAIGDLPTSGTNVVVLQTFDNDGDPTTQFGAGSAADLIANQITSDGAGTFIYFNSILNTPRLVFSTNLNDPTADLKILTRMTNLEGNPNSLAGFGRDNFAIPEPATWMLLLLGFGTIGYMLRASRRRQKLTLSYR